MTSAVGLVGTSSGIASPPVVSAPAAPTPPSASTAAAPVHNPRIIQDPTAGIITEYLSADGGRVVSQTPSAIAVAYMRLGIASAGQSQASTESVMTMA